MSTQLEADLREAFALHASDIPLEAADRLSRIDYRPRTSRFSPRLTVGALAGAATTTGAIVSVVVLGGAPAAFAGWSPTPTTASSAQTAATAASCAARLATSPVASPTSGWSVVTTDVRGPFSLVIYQSGSSDMTCFTGPSITVVSQSSPNGASMSSSVTASGQAASGQTSGTSRATSSGSLLVGGNDSGDITDMSVVHLDSSQGSYTLAEGRVAAGVSGVTLGRVTSGVNGVTLNLSDDEPVQTTTGNGWFVAWWPGAADATSVEITTSAGVSIEPLNFSAPPQSPASGTCPVGSQATSTQQVGGSNGVVSCSGTSGPPGTSEAKGGTGGESSSSLTAVGSSKEALGTFGMAAS